ncbi:alpha/beta hydrolase [Paraglaciecola sp.]|uniref:alpha/beta hydrolase n=1 Tax=Paraglaciecola sp. TaxID=1920173 RepID=UPI003EF8EC8F
MSILKVALTATLITISIGVWAKPISFSTNKNIEVKGDYYAPTNASKLGVLMLHQCNFNRSMYNQIGLKLAKQGVHALSIDFRGFGESTDAEFDVNKVRELPENQRRKAWGAMSADWSKDVQKAYDFLQEKTSSKGKIGVIGASCGGGQAINLAQNNPIEVIGFFSSAQGESNIARYQSRLANKPTLIIAAEDDGNTFVSAQTLFKTTTHPKSKFISYKGGEHGYPLLKQDQHLATEIVNWFTSQLVK